MHTKFDIPPTLEDYKSLPASKNRMEFGFKKNNHLINTTKTKPLVTVITVAVNAEATLEKTIQSIKNQTYKNIEYIIIDGDSKDGTKEIIRKNSAFISYALSEPDKGISDAFNKGIANASGEIIGIINADDWYEDSAIETVVNKYLLNGNKIYHGNLFFHTNNPTIARVIIGNEEELETRMSINHPTVFIPKDFYAEGGLYRNDLKIAMDYELMLRFKRLNYPFEHLRVTLAHMKDGGLSTKKWKYGYKECHLIRKLHGKSLIRSKLLFYKQCAFTYLRIFLKGFIAAPVFYKIIQYKEKRKLL